MKILYKKIEIYKSIMIYVVLALFILFFYSFGKQIEGYLFPVSRIIEITKIEVIDTNSIRIWGKFEKFRNCSLEKINWYLGTPIFHIKVHVFFEQKTFNANTGISDFGPLVIHINENDFINQSFVLAQYKCHLLWNTETKIFPSKELIIKSS